MQGGKPTQIASMHLKAQEADDIHWMQQDETQRENWNSGTSGKKDFKTSSSHSHSQSSNTRPNSTLKPHSSTNGNSASSSSKDKTKPNLLANKLGKNGKLTGDERERRIKEGLCLYGGKSGHVAQDCPKAQAAKACAVSVESKDSADSKNSPQPPRMLHGLRVALTLTA